ncbi:MAG: DUF962 domain-containing protein, partial [Maritimibacter sp.]
MRKIDRLLAEYGESHENPTNKLVHWICVPVIFTCVAAFFYSLPVVAGVSLFYIAAVLTLLYYITLSPRLALGFVGVLGVVLGILAIVEAYVPLPLWQVAAIAFVIAWIGQFWGHSVEGKRPSFFKDLQFLLIGPAWLMSHVFQRFGIVY